MKPKQPRRYVEFNKLLKEFRKKRMFNRTGNWWWCPVYRDRLLNGDLSVKVAWTTPYQDKKLVKLAHNVTNSGRFIFKRVPLAVHDWDSTVPFKQAMKLHQVLRRLDKL